MPRKGVTRVTGGRSSDQGLFGVKKQQFGVTRSSHGKKVKINFHQLVFDAKTNRARVARKRKVFL